MFFSAIGLSTKVIGVCILQKAASLSIWHVIFDEHTFPFQGMYKSSIPTYTTTLLKSWQHGFLSQYVHQVQPSRSDITPSAAPPAISDVNSLPSSPPKTSEMSSNLSKDFSERTAGVDHVPIGNNIPCFKIQKTHLNPMLTICSLVLRKVSPSQILDTFFSLATPWRTEDCNICFETSWMESSDGRSNGHISCNRHLGLSTSHDSNECSWMQIDF